MIYPERFVCKRNCFSLIQFYMFDLLLLLIFRVGKIKKRFVIFQEFRITLNHAGNCTRRLLISFKFVIRHFVVNILSESHANSREYAHSGIRVRAFASVSETGAICSCTDVYDSARCAMDMQAYDPDRTIAARPARFLLRTL